MIARAFPYRMGIAAAALFLVLQGVAAAQEPDARVIVLHYADSLVGRVIDGEQARELIGNVDISQENVHIRCDRALQFLQRGVVHLTGHIVVRDSNVTLLAPRGIYYRDLRRAEAFDSVTMDDGHVHLTSRFGRYDVTPRVGFFQGNVAVRDSVSLLRADSLTYFRTTRRSLASGRVSVYSIPDRITIYGGLLDHDQPRQHSIMSMEPRLVQVDSSSDGTTDTLVVRSQIMEAFRDSSRRFLAIDSVRLAGRAMAGRAGYAEFHTQADSIILRRAPVLWYEHTQVAGDSVFLHLHQRKLQRVLVLGNALAVSQTDSLHPARFDQMSGERMLMTFARKALDAIDVTTRAIGLYHLYDDTTANGLNRISGDRILMRFSDGVLETIHVNGGVEGQYVPENILVRGGADFDIPGAVWRRDRPVLRRDAAGIPFID